MPAVGNLAVQLAREAGARIVGTGRGRDRAATPAGGAQQFADLDSERFEEVAGQVDVVLDTIGGEVLDRSAAVVRPGGMLVSVALPPKIRPVDGRAMYFVVEPNGGELAELARRVQQGRLAPPVGAIRPLAETREAFLGKQGTRQDRHKGRLIAQEPGGCCSPFPAGRVSVRQPRGTVTRHCRARVGSCL